MLDPLERTIQHSENGVHNYLTGRGWEASILYLLAQVIMVGRVYIAYGLRETKDYHGSNYLLRKVLVETKVFVECASCLHTRFWVNSLH